MAVAFEGFCIREFASKMRSVDVAKSWPFSGVSDMKQIESALPPITFAKFRWWQHELDAARSSLAGSSNAAAHLEEKSDEPLFGCTDSGVSRTHGNETAATQAEIRNFEKQQLTRAKSKSKTPKKRSIVEIFAVTPPIDTVSRQEGSSTGRNSCSTSEKKKNRKKAALKKRHLPILDRKLKKKVCRNASFAIKESCHKFKRKTASELSRNFDKMRGKMFTGDTLEDTESCQRSSSHKKHTNIAPSEFITKKHKAIVIPFRGILKKQRKYVSGKDTTSMGPEENSQVADKLEKHVTFLVENDEANPHVVTQQSSLHEIRVGVDQSGRNEVEVEAVSQNDNSICVEELQFAKEKENTLPETCSQGNLKNYLQRVSTFQEDLNDFPELPTSPNSQILEFCGDLNAPTKGKSKVSDDASYLCHSGLLSTFNRTSSSADVAGTSVRPISFSSEFISSQQLSPGCAVHGASSVPRITNTSLQSASVSSLVLNENVNDQRFASSSQSIMPDSSFNPSLYQPVSRPHQMNQIGGSFSCKQWNLIGATSSKKSLNENHLYGLPLNSRGELVQLSSSGNFMLDQQSDPPSRFPGQTAAQQRNVEDIIRFKGNHTDEKSRSKHLDLFPLQVNADKTLNSIPYRKGMAEPHGTIMENSGVWANLNSSSHLIGTGLNLLSPSGDGTKVPATTTPPVTMRLMGKDVSIGRNSKIGSEEDKVWTDKEIILEQNDPSSPRIVKNFFPQDPILNPVPEKSRGLVNISFGGQNNSEYYRFPPPEPPRVRDPYFNWQPDATVQIGRVPPITRCHQGGTVFHVENVRDPYLNEEPERLMLGSQNGTPFVPLESNWIDIQWGPHPRYRQNHVHAPRVTHSFGFAPDCRDCFQESYWSQNYSFKEIAPPPPCLLYTTPEQRNTPYTDHHPLPPFPDRQQQHLYASPTANSWSGSTQPSFHFPEPYCCSYNPMGTPLQMRSPFGVNNNYRVRDHNKRSAVFDVDLRKPYKVPALERQVFRPS